MKIIALVFMLLVVGYGQVEARDDKIIILASYALADYNQTTEVFFEHRGEYCEINPILRKQPTRHSLALFGVVSVGTVWVLHKVGLPDLIVDSIIETERLNIEANKKVSNGEQRNGLFLFAVAFNF